jgi:hypothetical protein
MWLFGLKAEEVTKDNLGEESFEVLAGEEWFVGLQVSIGVKTEPGCLRRSYLPTERDQSLGFPRRAGWVP